MKRTLILGLLTSICISSLAYAEDDAIATDRPDFVESSQTVGKMRLQIETSYAEETDKVDGIKTKTTSTPTLFRFGVSPNVEMRLETEGFISEKVTDTDQINGSADHELGFKVHLYDGQEGTVKPSIGCLVHAAFDSGSAEFRGHAIRPSFRMVGEWELPYDMSMGLMPGLAYETDEEQNRYINTILALVIGKSWTKNFRNFIEVSGQQLAPVKHGGNILTFDAGVAYLILNNYQIDTAASWAMNDNTPDFSWTIGFSARLGRKS